MTKDVKNNKETLVASPVQNRKNKVPTLNKHEAEKKKWQNRD